jgi:PAS domain-containing protein
MRHLPALRVLLIYPAPSTPCSLFDALQSNSSFQLEKVDHPSSGFEKALRDLPDVVLLACKPFNQETLQFCQKLRAQVSLPLILISNSPLSDQEHTIGLEAGALICLTFATPPSVLVATLHSLRSHLTAHKRNHERVHKENEALPLQFYHQKSFLETVMRLMPAGLSIASSPAGQLLFINEEAKRLLVGDPSSATPFDLESVRKRALHRDGTPYLPNEYPLARAINQGESIFGEEISFIHQDGKETCVAVYASPVHNDEGKIIAAVSIFFDIARQK